MNDTKTIMISALDLREQIPEDLGARNCIVGNVKNLLVSKDWKVQ